MRWSDGWRGGLTSTRNAGAGGTGHGCAVDSTRYRALRLLVLGIVLAFCGAWAKPVAMADYEELELRLKAVDVDVKLRARVHEAIERGSAYLRLAQSAEGRWRSPAIPSNWEPDAQVLCALALRHAGGRANEEAVARALPGLLESMVKPGYRLSTYGLGLLGMLLMLEEEQLPALRAVSRRLRTLITSDTGWWDYVEGDGRPNLSTSQFGALGLWAASRIDPTKGADMQRAWRSHLDALLRLQTSEGSYPYFAKAETWIRAGYWTATFMGHANLLLCRAALGDVIQSSVSLKQQFLAAEEKGLRALVRHGQLALQRPEGAMGEAVEGAHTPYYRLYALEKACIFAGIERLGRIPWYATGARFLIRNQRDDGSWGYSARGTLSAQARKVEGDAVSTALAVLFLVRSSEVYRPTTPRPVDAQREVTPGSK